ncbi:pseudouridine synthase [Dermabacteraceae bacterium P13077]
MSRGKLRRTPGPLPPRGGLSAIRAVPAPGVRAVPLREWLTLRYPALLSPAATPLAQRIAAGDFVRRNGSPYTATDPVSAGDEVFFYRELAPETVPDTPLPVLFSDASLLVIDKPHGTATMPRGTHVRASALVRLREIYGPELTPVHRLDKDTAGVLVFSRVPAERSAYQELFAARLVTKTYLARTLPPAANTPGMPALGESRELRHYLSKPPGSLRVTARSADGAALPGEALAHTRATLLSTDADGALWRLNPVTGRTHQLRVQLAALGTPILSDPLYGPAPKEGAPPLQLLAHTLAFTDPFSGRRHEFTSRRALIGQDTQPPGE